MKNKFERVLVAAVVGAALFWLVTLILLAGPKASGQEFGPYYPGANATATANNGNQYWVRGTNYGGPFPLTALSAPYPGDALQAVLNLMVTNGETFNSAQVNTPSVVTSNSINGHLHVYGFNNANNQQGFYYRSGGFVYSNTWIIGEFNMEGDGELNTLIVGDSNAFSWSNPSAVIGTCHFQMGHIGWCFSNSWAKSVCVNVQGICPGEIDNCSWDWMADEVYSNYLGIGGSAWSDQNGTALAGGNNGANAAMVGINIAGLAGHITVMDCMFSMVAAGIVCSGEHARIIDDEFVAYGMFNNTLTNGWRTNDLSYIPLEYGGSLSGIRGCDIALGPAIVVGSSTGLHSGDDIEMLGDKTLGGGIGVLVKTGDYFYGIPKLIDCHFEAVGSGQGYGPPIVPKDVVLDNDTNYFVHNIQPIFVSEHDCSDQQTSDGAVVNWQFNGTNFLLSTNFPVLAGFGTNFVVDYGVYLTAGGNGFPEFMVKTNNVLPAGGILP